MTTACSKSNRRRGSHDIQISEVFTGVASLTLTKRSRCRAPGSTSRSYATADAATS